MVAVYKWSLRKGGKKERCPQCGHKRFVPFVLTADPSVKAGELYGRCDREQSCGYFRYPGSEVAADDFRKPEPRPELPLALFKFPTTLQMISTNNTLYKAFENLVGFAALGHTMLKYKIMTGDDGSCIFPQFDGSFLRTAKAIMYGSDGHRLKRENGEALPVYWLHKSSEHAQYMESHQLKQCLFGQHLLSEYPRHDVMVVEAEKTAVLMAATTERTDRVWLACGGSQMLKGAIDLQCLEGRNVTLIPDHGQYWNWKRTADAHGWNCYDIKPLKELHGLPDGCDIWDCVEDTLRKEAQR